MEIKLGEKIKALRKARGISQEILAQALGCSFQAVSKWETGVTMPDVAIIPAIASFFGVSTDELFDYNRMEAEKRVMDICREAAEFRRSDPAKSEAMLREGLKQFPGNDIILNNLLYTMRSPERSGEVISICKTLAECTREDDVKYDALRILAETYYEIGEKVLVKPTLEQIPEIYFSKLELCAKYLEGEESLEAAMMHKNIALGDLVDMLIIISARYQEKGEPDAAAKYRREAVAIWNAVRREEGEDFAADWDDAWLEKTKQALGIE